MDYIHYNPVKHGYVSKAVDWPYSSVHQYIKDGQISPEWGVIDCIDEVFFGEW